MSDQPTPEQNQQEFNDVVEAQRQELIEQDIEMHKETDEDTPVSADGDLSGTEAKPAKKAAKKATKK